MSSRTFIVEFTNGDAAAIVHTAAGQLGLGCAVSLALQAYTDATGKSAPAILSARYETDGKVFASYDAKQLNATAA